MDGDDAGRRRSEWITRIDGRVLDPNELRPLAVVRRGEVAHPSAGNESLADLATGVTEDAVLAVGEPFGCLAGRQADWITGRRGVVVQHRDLNDLSGPHRDLVRLDGGCVFLGVQRLVLGDRERPLRLG